MSIGNSVSSKKLHLPIRTPPLGQTKPGPPSVSPVERGCMAQGFVAIWLSSAHFTQELDKDLEKKPGHGTAGNLRRQ